VPRGTNAGDLGNSFDCNVQRQDRAGKQGQGNGRAGKLVGPQCGECTTQGRGTIQFASNRAITALPLCVVPLGKILNRTTQKKLSSKKGGSAGGVGGWVLKVIHKDVSIEGALGKP